MKILKLHIENFGTIHDYDLCFNSNFNEIIEENGWGKTTIANFIKAMFYGLPNTTKRNLDENERKKYSPWQGGSYGGYLDFEISQEQYRIERFFDNGDSFNLIDLKTGKESKKYSSNIGEEIFDLDAQAYERSTFIPQKEIANGITGKINSKLINMIQGTNSPDSLNNAKEILEKRRKYLKKQGNSGKIAEVEAEIENVSEKIDNLKQSALAIDHLQNDVTAENEIIIKLEKDKEEIDRKIKVYSEIQKVVANKKYIEENQAQVKELENKISDYQVILNGNDFSDDEIKNFSKINQNILSQKTKLQTLQENTSVKEKFNNLKEYFKVKVPTESEIENQIKNSEKIKDLNNEIANLKAEQNKNLVIQTSNTKKSKTYLIPLVFSVICAVVGGILITSLQTYAIVAFIVAGLCMLASGFVYFKNYIEIKTSNYNSPSTMSQDLTLKIEERITEIEKYQSQIDEFISNYEENIDNPTAFLYNLLSKLNEFKECQILVQDLHDKTKEIESYINLAEKEIKEFLARFNCPSLLLSNEEKLNLLKQTKENLFKDKNLLEEINKKLAEFKKENVISNETTEDFDIDEIQESEKQIQEEIDSHKEAKTKLIQRIDQIKSELSSLDDYENQLDQLNEERESLNKEFSMLASAKSYLEKANDNLSSKYLSPLKNSLNNYLKLILDKNYQEYNMDTNLEVSFEKFGKSRELDYLSKGYQGVVDLCIRFALIDSLFEKEKPFIILDDPFVNMDEPKIAKALELLKEISKEYQLIYLICHKSRA